MKKQAESLVFGVYKVYTRIKQSVIKHFDRGQHIAQDIVSTVRKKAIASQIGNIYGRIITRILEGSVESVDVFMKKLKPETAKRLTVDTLTLYQDIAMKVALYIDEHEDDFVEVAHAAKDAADAFKAHMDTFEPEMKALFDTVTSDLKGLGERIKRYTKEQKKPSPQATKKTTTAKQRSTKKEKAKSEATSGSNDPVK